GGGVRLFWLPIAAGFLAACALWVALPKVLGPLPVLEQRQADLRFWPLLPVREYTRLNVELVLIVTFPFAPLLICPLTRRRRALAIAGVAIALLAAVRLTLGLNPTPLPEAQTWALEDLAMRTNLIVGELQPSAWTMRAMPLVKVAGAMLVASLLVAWASRGEGDWRAGRPLLAAGALHLILINVIWSYYDRYYLVLVP